MAEKPAENLVYDFLYENAATFGAKVEIQPSAYERRKEDNGITVGDAETAMEPNGNGDAMTEFNAEIVLVIYARVAGPDKTCRTESRQRVFDIKSKLMKLLDENSTMNGRVCKFLTGRQTRLFDDQEGDIYAIEVVPLVINPFNFAGDR